MADAFEIRREMGCTRREFLTWLPGATRHAPVQISGDTVRVTLDSGSVEITLAESPARRVALLTLPVLAVRLRFDGIDEAARQAFIDHFDLYTRRGGG
jgi:hypothetical protein